MNDPIINGSALQQPRNRQLLIIIGLALLALIVIGAIWQTTGTHGAKRDVAAANDKVFAKQKEVDDARRTYEQKVAELRALRAEADAQATKLGGALDAQVQGTVNDARVDLPTDPAVGVTNGGVDAAPEYYVRDRHGRFVRVVRP
jgi:hypothetical protein